MARVHARRMTAAAEGGFVVFLIGMRVNKPWKLHRWVPVARAMGPMLRTLGTRPDLGLLGYHLWISPTGPMVVQYWRDRAALERFARDPHLPHQPAWRRFNRLVGTGGDVGIWHETYDVPAGAHESVYVNMPRFGLAAAAGHAPAGTPGRPATATAAAPVAE